MNFRHHGVPWNSSLTVVFVYIEQIHMIYIMKGMWKKRGRCFDFCSLYCEHAIFIDNAC